VESVTTRQVRSAAAGCAAVLLAWATSVPAAGEGDPKPAAKAAPGAAPAAAAGSAGLHVTVYETRLPADRVAGLDVAALLAKADTTAGLQAALSKLGQTRILYHAYQLTALSGQTRIHLLSRRPFVAQSRVIPSRPRAIPRARSSSGSSDRSGGPGRVGPARNPGRPRTPGSSRLARASRIHTVQYESVGMIFKLSLKPTGAKTRGALATHMELELSTLADSGVEVAKGVQASEVRKVRVDRAAGMRVGKPSIAVQIDASRGAKDARATAYVCRVLLSETP
jgi:hypothetical protein